MEQQILPTLHVLILMPGGNVTFPPIKTLYFTLPVARWQPIECEYWVTWCPSGLLYNVCWVGRVTWLSRDFHNMQIEFLPMIAGLLIPWDVEWWLLWVLTLLNIQLPAIFDFHFLHFNYVMKLCNVSEQFSPILFSEKWMNKLIHYSKFWVTLKFSIVIL